MSDKEILNEIELLEKEIEQIVRESEEIRRDIFSLF